MRARIDGYLCENSVCKNGGLRPEYDLDYDLGSDARRTRLVRAVPMLPPPADGVAAHAIETDDCHPCGAAVHGFIHA